jgi:penicillin-binding protein 1A
MGITSKLNGYPAETLGGLENGVSPLEMATAYATIASGGVYHRPRAITKIREADGTVLTGRKLPPKLRPYSQRRFSDGVTSEATKILEQNVKGGTGTAANIGCPAAGKTGTTDEHSDGWFVGYTPNLSTAVWVGYPNAAIHMFSEYHGGPVAGGTYPAEIWHDYMASAKKGCGAFPAPKEAFQAQPFYGRYAGGSKDDSTGDEQGTTDPNATPVPGADTGTDDTGAAPDPADGVSTDDTGGQGYDPALYESPPQDGN